LTSERLLHETNRLAAEGLKYAAQTTLDATRLAFDSTNAFIIETTRLVNDHIDWLNSTLLPYSELSTQMLWVLRNWRSDVNEAVAEYVKANGEFMINIMKHSDNSTAPLTDWVSCWGPVFLGIPSEVSTGICFVNDTLGNLTEDATKLMNEIIRLLAKVDPAFYVINEFNKKIEDLKEYGKSVSYDIVVAMTDPRIDEIVDTMSGPMTAAKLDATFSMPGSSKHLVMIPDLSFRIDAEMHLDADGFFNPKKFRPVYNSVVLTKLTLLGSSELNRLASLAGVEFPGMYGEELYHENSNFNIAFDWIKSIDGNHQWQKYALPHFRAEGYFDELWKEGRSYGFGFDEKLGYAGLRIWEDKSARHLIFNTIFHGPMAPGIENPDELGIPLLPLSIASTRYSASADNPFPVVADDPVVVAVSAGELHTMILKSDGSLWGAGANASRQLGDHTGIDRHTPVRVMDGVSAVAAAGHRTMILKSDGTLLATGQNGNGQLGNGTTTNVKSPEEVMSGIGSVFAGNLYTMILKNEGSLWGTGYNAIGQLGDDTTIDRSFPVHVMDGVSAAAADYWHTMILKNDMSLWGTGNNSDGQLGDGTFSRRILPVHVMSGVSAVSVGGYHTVILKSDGILYAAGQNKFGQLGDGTNVRRSNPVMVMDDVRAVAAAGFHTMILKSDGTLWGTGRNDYGQFGNGTTTDQNIPIHIMDEVAAVWAGPSRTIILKKNGTLWGMGRNDYGQLGDGTTINRSFPVLIME
jgi:alpha-tubulin suppressor-like RCC1 family protein